MKSYMKIKELSKLTGVSVRTLQYYDEINLLNPAYTNEHGHRFYDSSSFSKMFVIISLKNLGMNLHDIHQYINHGDFDLQHFIAQEKRRIETTIADLQVHLIQLSIVEEQANKKQDLMQAILPLFSKLTNDLTISKLQMEQIDLTKQSGHPFDLQGWHSFIQELNYCTEHQLPANNLRTISCIEYWQQNVIEPNQVSDDLIKKAELFYEQNPGNNFGMTEQNYRYLVRSIHDSEHHK